MAGHVKKRISEERLNVLFLKYVNEVGINQIRWPKSCVQASQTFWFIGTRYINHFFATIARQIEDRAYKNG